MRKLVFGINLTIDGCCDHTKGNPDDEVHDYFTRLTREAGVLLYGRKTYQLMVPFWPEVAKNPAGQPKGMIDFAQAFVSVPRIVVFSKTLDKPESQNTTILRSNLQDEILKLKQEPGGSILVGGVDLSSQLFKLGLVDEVHIVIHPVIVGEGGRLFDGVNFPERFQMKLVGSQFHQSGAVALHYLNANQ